MTNKKITQQIWGLLLFFAGSGMLLLIPGKIEKIQTTGDYSPGHLIFLRICFYIMAVILITGGVKKLYNNLKKKENSPVDPPDQKA